MKFKLKTIVFECESIKCNLCGSDIKFNIIKIKSEPHNNILGCLNTECYSNINKLKRKEIWKAFLPEGEYDKIYKKMYDVMLSNNRLKKSFWIKNGLSEDQAKLKIFEIQSDNSKKVKKRFVVSKENLKNKGYSDNDIKNICQTPSMKSFWINKGLSESDAELKVSEHQSNSAKKVDFKKRLLPSNVQYWINKGFSKDDAKNKVSDSQRTFSISKCIEKYGELEGTSIWEKRQEKWQKSLYRNGNIKGGYSKISQELFDILSKYFSNVKYATRNSEMVLRDQVRNYYYDFVDVDGRKIIEYNGDQYHANPLIYDSESYPHPYRKYKGYKAKDIWESDLYKKELAMKNNYLYLIIWDSEYKQNKELVIQRCIDFLKN